MTHELKTLPEYFRSVVDGTKTFEVRKNDRDFKVGDTLILKAYNPASGFMGPICRKEISYVLLGGEFGIAIGYCVLGFAPSHFESAQHPVLKESK